MKARRSIAVTVLLVVTMAFAIPPSVFAQGAGPRTIQSFHDACKTRNVAQTLTQAGRGNSIADFCAGLFYSIAREIPKDLRLSASYFRRAADAGFAPAQYDLGTLYDNGEGVPADSVEAVKWYRKAAEQQLIDAQDALGVAYYNGRGVPKDLQEATRWFRMAAANGSGAAVNHLAVLARPQPTRQEPAQELWNEARRIYNAGNRAGAAKPTLAAAQAGNSSAQTSMGWHYENGVGVARNMQEAARWYRLAAENGETLAMHNLGHFYEEGQGVPEDWMQAAKWYQMSAERNNWYGQTALSRAYQFGIGVPQSRKLAIEWDRRASALKGQGPGYWERWLRDPSNNIGFRNEQEHYAVINGQLRTEIPLNEPVGAVFRNSAERMAFLRNARQRLDSDERFSNWYVAQGEYQRCTGAGGNTCLNPGPPP